MEKGCSADGRKFTIFIQYLSVHVVDGMIFHTDAGCCQVAEATITLPHSDLISG